MTNANPESYGELLGGLPRPRIPILFCKEGLNNYGAEKATLSLLSTLDPRVFEIHVLVVEYRNYESDFLSALRTLTHLASIEVVSGAPGSIVRSIRSSVLEKQISFCVSTGYKLDILCTISTAFLDIKRLSILHNWDSINLKVAIYNFVNKLFLPLFDRVFAVSDPVQRIASAYIAPEKVTWIGNGIKPDAISSQAAALCTEPVAQLAKDQLVYIGRLTPKKGVDVLLRAFAQIDTEKKLILVGTGPSEGKLRNLAQSLGIEARVNFTGYVPNVAGIVKNSYLIVLPSLLEGFPIILLEAMALHKCVIATDVGDIPKLVENETTGFLVPAGDVLRLRLVLEKAIASPSLCAVLGDSAYKRVVERFQEDRPSAVFAGAILRWRSARAIETDKKRVGS